MQVRVHGLSEREGETAFAFLVLGLATPIEREGLVELIGHLAPLVLEAERFAAELPDDCEPAMRLVGMPWAPPEGEAALAAQRALIEGAGVHGIEEAWFFQTGTSLPAVSEDPDDDDDDDDDAAWSHGEPPQRSEVGFPVDGYPAILDELDWEDFGLTLKLAGPWTPGESTVLLGFHAMWLAPYGGRYRNAAVTIDQRHHAAHLWVDRFAVLSSNEQQVHHLLWIASKLHEVTPIVHARFGGATMAQKYGGLLGDTSEDFVLGGNPLLAVHAAGGEAGVDAWLARQMDWSSEEVAQMLRELAIEIVTHREPVAAPSTDAGDANEDADDDAPDAERGESPAGAPAAKDELDDELDAIFEAAGIGIGVDGDQGGGDAAPGDDDGDVLELDDLIDEDDADAEADEDDEPDGASSDEAAAEPPRARQLTAYASELLVARARAGKLDPRAADHLRPLLAGGAPEHRLSSIVSILGAARDTASVPALIRILEAAPVASAALDLRTASARALGAIGDPAAMPVLSELATAPGELDGDLRSAAAAALAEIEATLAARAQMN